MDRSIYSWFNNSMHKISLTKNNRGDVSGLLISQDGDIFSVSGENECSVLRTLKDMSEGNYKKE